MVIQAQLKRRRASRNQRRDVRRTMQLLTPGKTAKEQFAEVVIHDISTRGLLVQTDAVLAIGEAFEIALPRSGPRQAEVVWTSGSFFGCRFLESVPPAVVSAALLLSMPERATPAYQGAETAPAPPEFGERLAALRAGRNWSLETLAERLGVSRQAVWYWESGQRLPRAEHFMKIAEVFEVQEQELIRQAPRTATAGRSGLADELRREVARRNGIAEDKVRIVIEF